jgi:two-component sensor histidine kinase/ligand-binding sensor protein
VHTKELLDSESWDAVLEMFARSVDVAVALLGNDGALIGKYHNPMPIWQLARAARPDWGAGCPFCLDPPGVCTAAADAERTRSTVVVEGLGGFAHTAAPIFLADRHMGTLFAGQVFDQYPELLLLEQVAGAYHLSGQEIWRLARQRVPVSRATLCTYGTLLGTLGQAYLQERNATILQEELAESNEKLRWSNQELQDVNAQLSVKVTALDQSLAEKDILLNEVHHRVNNNLTVIGSLLRMQAEASPGKQVADALRSSQFRVESMALIHAHLYNAVDWRAVNFASYATVLADNLLRAYGIDQSRIRLQVEIGPLELGVDKAIPAGLILNELISNALKHAFPDGRHGSIFIGGKLDRGQVELFVRDDGVGVHGTAHESTAPRRDSLGMKIMKILCHQLKGTFAQPSEPDEPGMGSTFRISFPSETGSRAASNV